MEPLREGDKAGLKPQKEETLGQVTVQIVPTKHFEKRFLERVGDWTPYPHHDEPFLESGILVRSWRPCTYYLDVEGIGRYVLAQSGQQLVGVTVLPRLYCHSEPALGPFSIGR